MIGDSAAQPGYGAIWGIFQHDGVRDLVRLDPQTLEFETVVGGLPILVHPVAPVAANGFIWLASDPGGTVQQYDAATGELVREITTGPIGVEPVVAYGDVWTLNHRGDSVTRIDVDTGDTRSVQLPGARPLLLTPVDDELLLVSDPGPTTWVVDPERMELIGTYEAAACYDEPGWLGSAFDGVLWRKRCNEDVVDVLDPRTGKVLDTFESPVHANLDPLPVDGILWFTTEADNTRGYLGLAGLDPRTREIVATYQATERITEGWAFAAFDAWWRWGDEGVLRVPADTLRAAAG